MATLKGVIVVMCEMLKRTISHLCVYRKTVPWK